MKKDSFEGMLNKIVETTRTARRLYWRRQYRGWNNQSSQEAIENELRITKDYLARAFKALQNEFADAD